MIILLNFSPQCFEDTILFSSGFSLKNFLLKYVYVYMCVSFLVGSDGKVSACDAGDLGSIPGLERSPGEGKGYYSLQYSGLENSMDCMYSPWGCKESDTTE